MHVHLLRRHLPVPVPIQHSVHLCGIQALQHLPRHGLDLLLLQPHGQACGKDRRERRLIVDLALRELLLVAGLLVLEYLRVDLPRQDAGKRALLGVRQAADPQRVVQVHGVEGVDQVVADDVADLLLLILGVAVDDVCCAVALDLLRLRAGSGGNDGAEAGELADLHGVPAAVAASADDQDGILAVVTFLACVVGPRREGKGEIKAVGPKDGPKGRDNVAAEGGAVVVGEAVGDFVSGVPVEEAVLLQAGLLVGVLQVVGLSEDVVTDLEAMLYIWAELLNYTGNVVAEDDGDAGLIDVEAPVARVVLIGVYCGIKLVVFGC